MADGRQTSVFDRRFARHLWRLIRIYWTSPADARWGMRPARDRRGARDRDRLGEPPARRRRARIFDGLEHRDMGAFAGGDRDLLRGHARLRLRIGLPHLRAACRRDPLAPRLTDHFLKRWMTGGCYLMNELRGRRRRQPAAAHPGGRARLRVERARPLALAALGGGHARSVRPAALDSVGLLAAPDPRQHVEIPGLMLWVAIAYAVVSMWITHRVGRRAGPDQLRSPAPRGRLPLRPGALPRQRRRRRAGAGRARRAAHGARSASGTSSRTGGSWSARSGT